MVREQALVEGEMYLSPRELPQGNVVVYAPEEEVAFEVVPGGPYLRLHRQEKILHQVFLCHRFAEVILPAEGEAGGDDGAGVSEKEDDGHAGEVGAHPAKQQVCSYVLDQAPPCHELRVEPVRPGILEVSRKRETRRFQESLANIVGPQILLAPEVPERADPGRVEGLEDVAVPSLVVDHLRKPGGPAPPAPGEKDGVSVAPLPEVHADPPEQPRERDAAHRAGFLPRPPSTRHRRRRGTGGR